MRSTRDCWVTSSGEFGTLTHNFSATRLYTLLSKVSMLNTMNTTTVAATPCDYYNAINACNIGERAVEFERGVVEKSSRENAPDTDTPILVDEDDVFLSFPMQDFKVDGLCLFDEFYCQDAVVGSDFDVSEPPTDDDETEDHQASSVAAATIIPADPTILMVEPVDITSGEDTLAGFSAEDLVFFHDLMMDLLHDPIVRSNTLEPVANGEKKRDEGYVTDSLAENVSLAVEPAVLSDGDDVLESFSLEEVEFLVDALCDTETAPQPAAATGITGNGNGSETPITAPTNDAALHADVAVVSDDEADSTARPTVPRICWEISVPSITEAFRKGLLAEHDSPLLRFATKMEYRAGSKSPATRQVKPKSKPKKPVGVMRFLNDDSYSVCEQEEELVYDAFLTSKMHLDPLLKQFLWSELPRDGDAWETDAAVHLTPDPLPVTECATFKLTKEKERCAKSVSKTSVVAGRVRKGSRKVCACTRHCKCLHVTKMRLQLAMHK